MTVHKLDDDKPSLRLADVRPSGRSGPRPRKHKCFITMAGEIFILVERINQQWLG